MRYTILIADDEKYNVVLIERMLLQDKNEYKVIVATNGKDAYELAVKYQPDLILMDWDMPEMTGITALKELKLNYITRNIPVIMQTGMASSENLQQALDAGAIDYVRKPYDKIELMARIRSALILHESLREINYHKQRIEAHTDELNKLSIIIKQTANVAILINPDGELEWANQSFETLYGFSLTEFIDKYGSNYLEASFNKENVQRNYKLLLEKKEPITYITECKVKNGFKWIQTTLTPIFDGDKIEKIIAIETDVTKEKTFEQELIVQNLQMKNLTESLQNTNIELENQKVELIAQKKLVETERQKIDDLLSNILPHHVVQQLKTIGYAKPRNYKKATVMFTDFKGFTKSCEHLSPDDIVLALHTYFSDFDDIVVKHFIEKIKTIGDSYMCAGGVPLRNRSNPFDVVLSGLEIQYYMNELSKFKTDVKLPDWKLRVGIHTGELIAGVVGKIKFAYDIWGDTVNIAKRIEAACEVGKVNVSETTYEDIKDYFDCEFRGEIEMKNRGFMNMYHVFGLKKEYCIDEACIRPNEEFLKILNSL